MDQEQFWKIRSEKYNNLKWVHDPLFHQAFISSASLNKSDLVLDVGTGTGIVANHIAPYVKTVIGLDTSQEMLQHCQQNNHNGNAYFVIRDIRDPFFHDNVFDKVTARLVFHHIIKDTQKAMDECYRILKNGGKMVLSEGVPPTPEIKEDYARIFKIKEERLTFLEADLRELMEISGFKNLRVTPHIMENFSVRNWLENSGLPKEKQDRIFKMHVDGSDDFKKAYNMKILNDDCLINIKNLIVIGEKLASAITDHFEN